MYLEHFNLDQAPFSLTPNTRYFCDLPTHQGALNELLIALRSGEGFVKVTGEVGSGKTLLCRKLLDSLGEEFTTAYIPNPDLTPNGLRRAFAHELGSPIPRRAEEHEVLAQINNRLLELHQENKRVILLIDESQVLTAEGLETIRLLTNFETASEKLLQIVLFGQPELDALIAKPHMRQLRQRITTNIFLRSLTRSEIEDYLGYRLTMAGYRYGRLFTAQAMNVLSRKSQGVPRVINVLCHKAMLVAYGRGQKKITGKAIKLAVKDTDYASDTPTKPNMLRFSLSVVLVTATIGIFWFRHYFPAQGLHFLAVN